jgi:hypothetical protein
MQKDFRPFCLQPSAQRPGIARLPADLRPPRQASSLTRRLARPRQPNRVHGGNPWVACVTDWSFSFRCSPPRIAASQLRFDTARLFAAQKRTSTALSSCLLRRTSSRQNPRGVLDAGRRDHVATQDGPVGWVELWQIASFGRHGNPSLSQRSVRVWLRWLASRGEEWSLASVKSASRWHSRNSRGFSAILNSMIH